MKPRPFEDPGHEPDISDLPEEERRRLLSVMESMLRMGIGAVYGQEDEGEPEASVDCAPRLTECRARCCTLVFAITKEEVREGRVRHDRERPFFIAREADGYCTHLDRGSLGCTIWEDRPLRCRRYDCASDAESPEPG